MIVFTRKVSCSRLGHHVPKHEETCGLRNVGDFGLLLTVPRLPKLKAQQCNRPLDPFEVVRFETSELRA